MAHPFLLSATCAPPPVISRDGRVVVASLLCPFDAGATEPCTAATCQGHTVGEPVFGDESPCAFSQCLLKAEENARSGYFSRLLTLVADQGSATYASAHAAQRTSPQRHRIATK